MSGWGFSRGAALAAYFAAAAACGQPPSSTATAEPSDDEIKRAMVLASVAAYDGACPCPETLSASGRACGDNSAYRRQGGTRILCYPTDVTTEMVRRYRDLLARH